MCLQSRSPYSLLWSCIPALLKGLKSLPHATAAFIFVILLEGEEADSCCCPAVMSDHRAQPRCVSLSVMGKVAPGPRAKGQGSCSEGSVPGELGGEHRNPVAGKPVIAPAVKLAVWMTWCQKPWGSGSLTVQRNQSFSHIFSDGHRSGPYLASPSFF